MMLEVVATFLVTITAYAPGCGATGATKSGALPVSGHSVAVDPRRFRLGTLFRIEGMEQAAPFIATDTGPLVVDLHLDVYMDTCKQAKQWGSQKRTIHVVRPQEKRK